MRQQQAILVLANLYSTQDIVLQSYHVTNNYTTTNSRFLSDRGEVILTAVQKEYR